MSISKHKV